MAITSLIASLAISEPVSALPVNLWDNNIAGTFNTSLIFGTGMRVSSIEKSLVNGSNNNQDKGDLNYKSGDFYAAAFKGVCELDVSYKSNYYLFVRADGVFDPLILYSNTQRSELNSTAKHILGRRARLLDCNVRKTKELWNVPVTVKAGRQVFNWGESTFISNGLNSINPFDVSNLRSPGNLVKTAFLPVWALRVDAQFNDKWSAFAWWQWHWQKTQLDPVGSMFSTTNLISPGGFFLMLVPSPPGNNIHPAPNTFIKRKHTEEGSNTQNYGVNVTYTASELNNTQIGLYGAVYSSRLPIIDGYRGDPTSQKGIFGSTGYLQDYPNHIGLLGTSFNTQVGDVALQGEYSLHIGQPLQKEVGVLIGGAGGAFDFSGGPSTYNERVKGYTRKSYSQGLIGATYNPGRIFGCDSSVFLWEAGACYIHGSVKGLNPYYNSSKSIIIYPDRFSAGYVLSLSPTYNNVFWSTNVTPNFSFNQGLFGNTPGPLSTFLKKQLGFNVGVTFDYLGVLQANIRYTAICNGTVWNRLRDRDFVQLSLTYSF